MDLNHFLRERQGRWQRLGELLDRVDHAGLSELGPRQADELFALYRLTSSDLNLVQTRTGNPSLVEFLEGLVARAYAVLSVPREAGFWRAWWMILRHYFPSAIRAEGKMVALSVLAMLAGALFGVFATVADPRSAELFLPPEHLTESPSARVARLEEAERAGKAAISTTSDHAVFTVFLFNNNIRVAVLGFALGLTFGLGTMIVLFYNGAMIGSLLARYVMDGQGIFFAAWVGPHGSIEIPCAIFGCAAGLMLARTQLRRNRGSIVAQIRQIRPRLVDMLVGTATLLVVAGVIEGGFSQINQPTVSYLFKIAVATLLCGLLIVYLFIIPASPRPADTGSG